MGELYVCKTECPVHMNIAGDTCWLAPGELVFTAGVLPDGHDHRQRALTSLGTRVVYMCDVRKYMERIG